MRQPLTSVSELWAYPYPGAERVRSAAGGTHTGAIQLGREEGACGALSIA